MTILPLRRLYIERQIQPEMLSFVSTDEVVALFNMSVFFPNILVRFSHALPCRRYFDHMNVRVFMPLSVDLRSQRI